MEERLSGADGELLAEVRSGAATVTLNRPAALNALSFGMLQGLTEWLDRWEHDERVGLLVFRGAGEKAFCAGGDIRALYGKLTRDPTELHEYFTVEYGLDYRIHNYPKTIVSLMDGIVMGGGMGLAQGTKMRIVGARTRMAMPETAIGLFPDVGGSYFLSRVPGELGLYLGLVGPTIRAADALYCGLADVSTFEVDDTQCELAQLREPVDRHFSKGSVPAIVESLRSENDPRYAPWAAATIEALSKRSPTLLCVTHEQIRRGARLSLADCFRMELDLMLACFDQGDIIEGIRALLIDKDNTPRWQRSRIEDVTKQDVAAFFAPRWTAAKHPLASLK
ncbi:MAG TPA: enoyl-CoA hydratase/isomerase family protein [Usitatibacter sp.]|nr:enoyl-CoA hydratase/isomerase family protein [Usitatibacter sp.]